MDTFLLWLGITVSGTVVAVVGMLRSEKRERLRLQAAAQARQCPSCGGTFDLLSVSAVGSPRITPRPGERVGHIPSKFQATCSACGLISTFLDEEKEARVRHAA
ncbi:hypothetical protein LY474_26515 [Myxococcus stipitatus]|uniref:hypothetical protein n=1 Tax=Myxococcus stipitatus TaxID=83455 RepID=UPI001F1BD9CB|nr:hypothetical protein [Myxococcus stipitatus]MCE9671364.1 hypothetical protein [Myxococcus stipitatus]